MPVVVRCATRRDRGRGGRACYHRDVKTLRVVVVAAVFAFATAAAADPRRAGRPQALSAGLSVLDVADNQVLPFLTASAVLDLSPRTSLVADASYVDGRDRLFGPRLSLRGGGRVYLRDALSNPYLAAHAVLYREFDVDFSGSDRSQQAATSAGAALSLGHELVASSGLAWTFEASAFHLVPLDDFSPAGLSLSVTTTLGYRF